jgi:2-iminobutanoate/2-iminopropanoate deaminase
MERKFEIVSTELAPKAVGTYSQGTVFQNICYFSGQIGLNPKTMNMAPNFKEQLDQILDNIDGLLKSQGLSREAILKTTIFLTDLANFGMINEAYEKFFKTPYPARSCVEVSALPKGALVEIEVIACK